jgi:hypothetical protein
MAFKMKGPSAFNKDGKGKYKVKKFIKGLFGKDFHTVDVHADLGEDTEFTVSKKRTKAKGPKGKKIYTGDLKEEIDTGLASMSKKD